MKACEGLFGEWFGHKYRPVFNVIPPEAPKIDQATVNGAISIIEALSRREYVHSYCPRCGDIIEGKRE